MKFKILIFLLFISFIISSLPAADKNSENKTTKPKLTKPALANKDIKTHNVGNMWLSVTNYGQFGAGEGGLPSCEFPANSDVEYLFYGGMWVGALVDGDTMVSVATDGANPGPGETRDAFFPGWDEGDTILVSSNRAGTTHFDSLAKSEQDFIALYTDTSATMALTGQKGMGIEITQKSYAWSYSYAEDFVIFDFVVRNISYTVFDQGKTFEKLFMGIYIDGDCGLKTTSGYAYDDLTGFMEENKEGDIVNIAWIKDNDGDDGTCLGVTGTRVLFPDPKTLSYNWWDPWRNWGPTDPKNPNDFGYRPDVPGQMYRIMSNGYIDMDQSEATMAPDPNTPVGADSRYFLSFGPFNLEPDDTLKLTMAYVGGLPGPGYDEFEDLGRNARWAKDVYDNPPADGIPDFKGPPPPPSPTLEVTAGSRMVTLKWSNEPEKTIDSFSREKDFQGYRVYRSRSGITSDMELLGEYDKIDGFGYDFGFATLNPDTLVSEGDTIVWYTYKDYGLTNGEFIYYSVTSFDSGYAPTGLEPLESSAVINMTRVAPSEGPESSDEMNEVLVVPNPYRLNQSYYDLDWEAGTTDTDRRIDFTQLPPKCTIRIYTLAGDLVDIIEHDYPSKSLIAHRESWDMVSRNIQAIASGIYLFSVEADGKNYLGKFVIIY